jgi:hypothetical protein
MVGAMVLGVIGLWVASFVLVLAVCRAAKLGDRTMEIACACYRVRDHPAIRQA